jgi:pyrroline-5-carboxylate reductase
MPSAEAGGRAAGAPDGSAAPAGSFGIVGLGRMAQALLLPLIADGVIEPAAVRAAVASEASARQLAASLDLAVSTDASEAWRCAAVLLAVKPQQLQAVASFAASLGQPGGAGSGAAGPLAAGLPVVEGLPVTGGGERRPLLISVLAGVRLERLQGLFPGWCCVRAVPNTPCLVRQGLTGLAWGADLDPQRRDWVRLLFARVGEVVELPESQLDAFLALTSSGPAFVALVVEALADGAVAAGLPRLQAQHLAHRTLAGTAALLHEGDLHPGQLKDMVSSPAGTTIAGLRELERAGVRSALIEAVLAAAGRSRELG